jgi:hypothetical protein
MKFNSIVYAACVLMVSLSAKADLIVATDDYVTFNWAAKCEDCNSVKGISGEQVDVTGNLVIEGYSLGTELFFDQSNLVSFQYDGPSNHIDKLVIHNANFDLNDVWFDLSEAIESEAVRPDYVSIIDGYTNFAENMTASGWISADFSKYTLDLSFDTFIAVDLASDEYIPFSKLASLSEDPNFNYTIRKDVFNINYQSNGIWTINVGSVPQDFGNSAQISSASNLQPTSVPEPSTLVLFGISVLGFLRLRTKKS